MRRLCLLGLGAFLVPLCLPGPGLGAEAAAGMAPQLDLTYAIYAAGLHTADLTARLTLALDQYRVRMHFATTGLYAIFAGGHTDTEVEGRFAKGQVQPLRFESVGHWSSMLRETVLDYTEGAAHLHPHVRVLAPPETDLRLPVPESLRVDRVDSVSAILLLLHRVNEGEGCAGDIGTFDGHISAVISARDAGKDVVPVSGRSPYAGTAQRCDFEGHAVGGFLRADDAEEANRHRHGTAWLAVPFPGAPILPIRLSFETAWIGSASMYLTTVTPLGADRPPPADEATREARALSGGEARAPTPPPVSARLPVAR